MSCLNGTDCREPAQRRLALAVLALMLAIFLLLSFWSFLPSRKQIIPDTIQYSGIDAVEGKRVFQAYNCMGCHTIVGNGAYLGPDLTRIHADAGAAWLAAFLPSAGGWPTSAAIQVQLQNPAIKEDAGTADLQAYRQRYPGAAERLDRRGGQHTLMPNLPLNAHEVSALIAFLKYTSAMNTEGWPPKPREARRMPSQMRQAGVVETASVQTAAVASATVQAQGLDPVAHGRKLAADLGCTACHATDQKRVVGPGWGGLSGREVHLADGTTVKADDDYLIRAIRQPDAQVVTGYPPHVMPSYDALVGEADIKALVAYLRSL
ncbi:c-type cytochrome [Pusillimonas sp. TS35]|uniref:cytochrome c n=1 Tax=Paracandidimonas lactea TaxID=2895524 RepID=UPI00136BBB31|nr:cytochrome c [Paracandidimonas lactea]MYN13903.1 c-type cytochrome [Pusillimonas sp. TS35]